MNESIFLRDKKTNSYAFVCFFLYACLIYLAASSFYVIFTQESFFNAFKVDFKEVRLNIYVSFVLIVCAFFSARFKYRVISIFLASVVFLFAAIAIIEFILSFGFYSSSNIYEYIDFNMHGKASSMTLRSALCFMLASVAVIALVYYKFSLKKIIFLIIIGLSLILLGYILLIECIFNNIGRLHFYSSSLNFHTSIDFIILGASITSIGFVEAHERSENHKIYQAVIIFFISFLLSLIFWQYSIKYESNILQNTLNYDSTQINKSLKYKLSIEFYSLQRLAHRHSLISSNIKWLDDAGLYIKHHDSIYLLGKINKKNDIYSITKKNFFDIDKKSLQTKIKTRVINKDVISLQRIQVKKLNYILVYFPFSEDGGIIALYQVDALINSILSELQTGFYNLDMYLNNNLVYGQDNNLAYAFKKQWKNTKGFVFYNSDFKLIISPSSDMFMRFNSQTPLVILIFGLILSMFTGGLFFQVRTYQQKNTELKKLNAELENFSYVIAHNLKSPLRHIVGYMNLIIKNPDNVNRRDEFLSNIYKSSTKMGNLIDSLLEYSSISRVKLKKSSFSLQTAIDEAISKLDAKSLKHVEWDISTQPYIKADYNLLVKMFSELFTNALKFSKPQQKICIEIKTWKIKKGIVIVIKDNGLGFNEKYQEKAFVLFHQLDKAHYNKGIGAGLAYVNRIIERHGGAVYINSEVYKGASVNLFFPNLY